MRRRFGGWASFTVMVAAVLGPMAGQPHAQVGAAAGNAGFPFQSVQGGNIGGANNAPVPPEGAWGGVITVTQKWIVVQNLLGQQFPIPTDSINLFLVRWPTSPERLTTQSVVEATGLDAGSNRVQTDHIDVYEGSATQLVRPAFYRINGFGRISSPLDYIIDYNVYGDPFPGVTRAMMPGEGGIPPRLHVVGPVVNRVPLQLAAPGNLLAGVIASPAGLTMTQITPGSVSYVKPGDLVYFVPAAANVRGLALAQFVVYKAVPIDQYPMP
jgi:hypothetical protein